MKYLLPFLAATILSSLFTWLLKGICFKYGWLSVPRERDVHKKPVPRVGGLAIFLSFMIVSIFCFCFGKYSEFGFSKIFGVDRHLLGLWLGGALIAFTMLFDDIKGLKAWQKLAAQTIASLFIIASGIGINTLANPSGGQPFNLNSIYIPLFSINGIVYHFSLLSDLLTLIWLVGMMNVVNFIDGVDGLAAGLSTIAFTTIFALAHRFLNLQSTTALISIVLVGSTLGFLFWNFPPAKIFMGDCGSMFLGFMLGVLPIISGGKLATVFLVLGFPIIDGLYVAVTRLLHGQNPLTTPDKTHLHHRFLRAGFSQRQSIILYYIISGVFAWVALRSTTLNKIIASIVLVVLLFLSIRILNILASKNDGKTGRN